MRWRVEMELNDVKSIDSAGTIGKALQALYSAVADEARAEGRDHYWREGDPTDERYHMG